MLELLQNTDRTLAACLNGGNHGFLDAWSVLLTDTLTWLPLFVCLLIMVVKNNEKPSQIGAVLLAVAVGAVLSLGLDDGIVKPFAGRLRPMADPQLAGLVAPVCGYTAEGFSFFSAHASNTMALAVFSALLIRHSTFTVMMVLWSLVNCWTRLYLGAHFMSDVIVGAAWGALVGWTVFRFVYKPIYRRVSTKLHFISSAYTRMGYAYTDIYATLTVMVLTFAVTAVMALVQ